jgi:5-methylcytosine-specific restriction endonuclease McrA
MTFNCSHKDCDFTTDSKVGLGVHKSRSHDLNKFVDIVCKYCDTEFEKKRSEVNRTDTHFCSRECHFSWKSENKTGDSEIQDCDNCGSDVRVYPSEIEKYDNHFCSNKCKQEFESEYLSGDSHWRTGTGNYEVCDTCKDEFHRTPSRSDGKNFCSTRCEAKYLKERQTGDTNSNWCGGYAKSYGSNWNKKRGETLERDGYKCKVCDMSREEHYQEYGRDLDVHHKIPIAEFDESEDANYLINLVTICRSCHGKLDKISRREADRKPSISV